MPTDAELEAEQLKCDLAYIEDVGRYDQALDEAMAEGRDVENARPFHPPDNISGVR